MKFFKLIRWYNLVILIFIFVILRICLLIPILNLYALDTLLPDIYYLLELLMTVLLAAAGYMINDYFDAESDNFQ